MGGSERLAFLGRSVLCAPRRTPRTGSTTFVHYSSWDTSGSLLSYKSRLEIAQNLLSGAGPSNIVVVGSSSVSCDSLNPATFAVAGSHK